jgi:hypothetical protein
MLLGANAGVLIVSLLYVKLIVAAVALGGSIRNY